MRQYDIEPYTWHNIHMENPQVNLEVPVWMPELCRHGHVVAELIFDGLQISLAAAVQQYCTLREGSSHALDLVNYMTTVVDVFLLKGLDFCKSILETAV
eukprot:4527237-Amphidinium_carterae.1